MSSRQSLFDKRLQSIEKKINKLSLGVAGPQNDDEMVCHDTANTTVPVDVVPARPSGILPCPEVLTTGGISSAIQTTLIIRPKGTKSNLKSKLLKYHMNNL